MYTFVICGDINIDLVKYNKDTKVNNYVNDNKWDVLFLLTDLLQ